ncbi:MAG TPA: hypothetical protein VK673_16830 [Chthoniobacterales bacterium]|nr:hypothetical protein [Chthoniobacterales bacterium]
MAISLITEAVISVNQPPRIFDVRTAGFRPPTPVERKLEITHERKSAWGGGYGDDRGCNHNAQHEQPKPNGGTKSGCGINE